MNNENTVEISITDFLKVLFKRWLIILLVAILFAGAAFGYTFTKTTQKYDSSVLIYVNNQSISSVTTKLNLTASDLSASQQLVDTYCIILTSRMTLEEVARVLKEKYDYEYTYEGLVNAISTSTIDSTEIFRITVRTEDSAVSMNIANTIANVLPSCISNIVNGSSAKVVDYAVEGTAVSRGFTKSVLIGFIAGFAVSYGLAVVYDLIVNDTVMGDEWLKEYYGDTIPVLATVPDYNDTVNKHYGYKKYGYDYGYGKYADSAKANAEKKDGESEGK